MLIFHYEVFGQSIQSKIHRVIQGGIKSVVFLNLLVCFCYLLVHYYATFYAVNVGLVSANFIARVIWRGYVELRSPNHLNIRH